MAGDSERQDGQGERLPLLRAQEAVDHELPRDARSRRRSRLAPDPQRRAHGSGGRRVFGQPRLVDLPAGRAARMAHDRLQPELGRSGLPLLLGPARDPGEFPRDARASDRTRVASDSQWRHRPGRCDGEVRVGRLVEVPEGIGPRVVRPGRRPDRARTPLSLLLPKEALGDRLARGELTPDRRRVAPAAQRAPDPREHAGAKSAACVVEVRERPPVGRDGPVPDVSRRRMRALSGDPAASEPGRAGADPSQRVGSGAQWARSRGRRGRDVDASRLVEVPPRPRLPGGDPGPAPSRGGLQRVPSRVWDGSIWTT